METNNNSSQSEPQVQVQAEAQGRPPTPPAVQFKFVTDSIQERSLIRRHAMQGVWRQRRQQNQLAQNNSRPASEIKPRKLNPKKENEKSKNKEKGCSSHHHRTSSIVRRDFDNAAAATDEVQPAVDRGEEEEEEEEEEEVVVEGLQGVAKRPDLITTLDIGASPASSIYSATLGSPSTLGGTELDPFGSLPIQIHQQEQDLLHLWLGTRSLPKPKSKGLEGLEASNHSERQSQFLIRALSDCSDAASLHGIIAFAASHLASMQGLKISALAVKHQVQAVQFITTWLKDPLLATSDNAISAVLRQLNIEMWWGTAEAAKMHRNALERMIDMRGGLSAFDSNPALVSSIYRVLLISRPGWFAASHLPYSSTLNTGNLLIPSTTGPKHLDIMKLQGSCDRLVGLFYNLREVRMTFPLGIHQISLHKSTHFVHQAIQLLHHFSRFSDPESEPKTTHAVMEEMCRMTSLFYIASIIGDSISGFKPQITTTLESINAILEGTQDLWTTSIELLYLSLVQSNNQVLRDLDRVQYVLGLMELSNRMPWVLWKKLRGALLDVLCGVSGDMDINSSDARAVYYDSKLLLAEVQFFSYSSSSSSSSIY